MEGRELGKIKERAQDTSPTSGAVIKGFFLISSPAAYKIELCFSAYKQELWLSELWFAWIHTLAICV